MLHATSGEDFVPLSAVFVRYMTRSSMNSPNRRGATFFAPRRMDRRAPVFFSVRSLPGHDASGSSPLRATFFAPLWGVAE